MRRSGTPEKADALLKLAAWCVERGLQEEAAVHYNQVLDLDPMREIAWRHLGLQEAGQALGKAGASRGGKAESRAQKQADRSWKTKLEKLRDGLQSKDAARRAKAEQELTTVTDPGPSRWSGRFSWRGGPRLQNAAVQMLGQIDGPSASNGLAALAVFSRCPSGSSEPRALKRRDPRIPGAADRDAAQAYKYEVVRPHPVAGRALRSGRAVQRSLALQQQLAILS